MWRGHLRDDICDLKDPAICNINIDPNYIRESIPPSLQYACEYWIYHTTLVKSQASDAKDVSALLKEHLTHWLEALLLTANGNKGILMLKKLQEWAQVGISGSFCSHSERRLTSS